MKTKTNNKTVSFAKPLVTAIHHRPITTNTEKKNLFYSADDYRAFREKRKRQQRRKQQKEQQKHLHQHGSRRVQFAPKAATSILFVPRKRIDSLGECFYSELEIQGFLKDYVQTLETNLTDPSFVCTEEEDSECFSVASEEEEVDNMFSSFLKFVAVAKKEETEEEINVSATQSNSFKQKDCDGVAPVATTVKNRKPRNMLKTYKHMSSSPSPNLDGNRCHGSYHLFASSIEKHKLPVSNKTAQHPALLEEKVTKDVLYYSPLIYLKNKYVCPIPPRHFGQQYSRHHNDNDVCFSFSQKKIENTLA